MAFKNNFVVAVLMNGSIQAEDVYSGHSNRPNGCEVTLPNGAEYGLRLRNKTDRRAVGEVRIDGENVGEFVIDARSYIDIFRSAHKDRAFKLVGTESAEVVDHGKNSDARPNGTVVVRFRQEKQYPRIYKPYNPPTRKILPSDPWAQPHPYDDFPYRVSRSSSRVDSSVVSKFAPDTLSMTYNAGSVPISSRSQSEVGVTVEGGRTGQNFREVQMELEDYYTEIVINLRVLSVVKAGDTIVDNNGTVVGIAIAQDNGVFCGNCGKRRGPRITDRFCSNCGVKF